MGCCWEGVVVYVSALFLWVLLVGMCLLWFVCMLLCKFVGMLVSIASALFYVYVCMYVCMYCFCFVLYVCLYVSLYVCLWVGRVFCWGLSLSSSYIYIYSTPRTFDLTWAADISFSSNCTWLQQKCFRLRSTLEVSTLWVVDMVNIPSFTVRVSPTCQVVVCGISEASFLPPRGSLWRLRSQFFPETL